MAGLYIHIPFCKSRCIYCGFYSTTNIQEEERYIGALCRELELRGHSGNWVWNTIYIGGGTPSLLSAESLFKLFRSIDFSQAKEITIECNPDDVTREFAHTISKLPVNRVSMGVQTFNESRLKFLHRRHSAAEVYKAIDHLRGAGITNISIDLIYGFPEQTTAEWKDDLAKAMALGVEHLSAYSLMYEDGTVLGRMLELGKVSETDEETSREMFEILADTAAKEGFEHYEISNFAKPGLRSMHNSSYWNNTPYMGIGAAAHSYDGNTRRWNASNIQKYISSIKEGIIPEEVETLSTQTKYNDFVMLSLRTAEGIDIKLLEERFGKEAEHFCRLQAGRYLDNKLLEEAGGHLRLSREGIFVSDMIMSDLMQV